MTHSNKQLVGFGLVVLLLGLIGLLMSELRATAWLPGDINNEWYVNESGDAGDDGGSDEGDEDGEDEDGDESGEDEGDEDGDTSADDDGDWDIGGVDGGGFGTGGENRGDEDDGNDNGGGSEGDADSCNDGSDNDEDGATDCDDSECMMFCEVDDGDDSGDDTTASGGEDCWNGVDDDDDGHVDADDGDCSAPPPFFAIPPTAPPSGIPPSFGPPTHTAAPDKTPSVTLPPWPIGIPPSFEDLPPSVPDFSDPWYHQMFQEFQSDTSLMQQIDEMWNTADETQWDPTDTDVWYDKFVPFEEYEIPVEDSSFYDEGGMWYTPQSTLNEWNDEVPWDDQMDYGPEFFDSEREIDWLDGRSAAPSVEEEVVEDLVGEGFWNTLQNTLQAILDSLFGGSAE